MVTQCVPPRACAGKNNGLKLLTNVCKTHKDTTQSVGDWAASSLPLFLSRPKCPSTSLSWTSLNPANTMLTPVWWDLACHWWHNTRRHILRSTLLAYSHQNDSDTQHVIQAGQKRNKRNYLLKKIPGQCPKPLHNAKDAPWINKRFSPSIKLAKKPSSQKRWILKSADATWTKV